MEENVLHGQVSSLDHRLQNDQSRLPSPRLADGSSADFTSPHAHLTLIHEYIINIAFFTCKHEGSPRSSLSTSSVDRNVETQMELQWKSPGVSQFCLPAPKEPCGMSTPRLGFYLKNTISTANAWTSLSNGASPSEAC